MNQYSWEKIRREIQRQPQRIVKIASFLEYITNPTYQQWCKGKKEWDFARYIMFEKKAPALPKPVALFFISKIFPYLQKGKAELVRSRLPQLSPKRVDHSIKLLGKIVTWALLPSAVKGLFQFPWKKSSGQMVSSPTTLVSAPPKNSGPPQKLEKSLLQAFQEETIHASSSPWTIFSNRKEKTILQMGAPLQDPELETLRVETLVAMKTPTILRWISLPNQENFLQTKAKARDLVKTLDGIASLSKLTKDQRNLISQLKHALLIRSKLLTQLEITINIINKGVRSFHHTIDRLANITNNKKVNKKIWAYLHNISQNELLAHAAVFRKKIEMCQSQQELDEILFCYTLKSLRTVKKYPELKIIHLVKKVRQNYEKKPQNLLQIMNKQFGANREVHIRTKLSQLLITSSVDADILRHIQKERDLYQIPKRLERLRHHPQFVPHIEKYYHLVTTFIDTRAQVSFQDFRVGLNMYSPSIVNKTLLIARRTLQREINKKITQLLQAKSEPLSKLQDLETLLTNPRYHDSWITVYGHSLQELYNKINSIDARAPNLERLVSHVFINNSDIPSQFISLVAQGKKHKMRGRQKNLQNCYHELLQISQNFASQKNVQLRNELVSLFKVHGRVEFSAADAPVSVNGYDVAQMITNFYNIPNRTKIELPEYVNAQIRTPLKDLIDNERTQQLEKMRRSQ